MVSYSDEGDPTDQLCGVLAWGMQFLETCQVTLDAEAYIRLGGGDILRSELFAAVARERAGGHAAPPRVAPACRLAGASRAEL